MNTQREREGERDEEERREGSLVQAYQNSLQAACKTWTASRMLPARVTMATGARAKKALTCAARVLLKVNPPNPITVPCECPT